MSKYTIVHNDFNNHKSYKTKEIISFFEKLSSVYTLSVLKHSLKIIRLSYEHEKLKLIKYIYCIIIIYSNFQSICHCIYPPCFTKIPASLPYHY